MGATPFLMFQSSRDQYTEFPGTVYLILIPDFLTSPDAWRKGRKPSQEPSESAEKTLQRWRSRIQRIAIPIVTEKTKAPISENGTDRSFIKSTLWCNVESCSKFQLEVPTKRCAGKPIIFFHHIPRGRSIEAYLRKSEIRSTKSETNWQPNKSKIRKFQNLESERNLF